MSARTRIKLCGLTRPSDVAEAVALGADAIGLVFYPPSPRYLSPQQAAPLFEQIPAFISTVGLFVNPTLAEVQACIDAAPISILQFHGDETPAQCAAIAQKVRRPFLRALRIRPEMKSPDLLEFEHAYRSSSPLFAGLLLDTWSDAYGGT
ncbi:MAG: phosphoribosylanthranilate isomerase, partial [Oxalobacteraceae bacterium]|nr:phosphoribosylanthranilate isomerase [Oxalobacteraceae bacterium]